LQNIARVQSQELEWVRWPAIKSFLKAFVIWILLGAAATAAIKVAASRQSGSTIAINQGHYIAIVWGVAAVLIAISGIVLLVLSLTALLTVLSGYTQPPQAPEADEGTAAHIFQLSIVALVPMILLFFATADWRQPWRSARPLVFPAAALVVAFAVLYYSEHCR